MTAASSQALTLWCRVFIETLVKAGLTDLVVSPGSRSTPVVLAALSAPKLSLHMVRDERAAAFFALGLVRASGRPAGLVCTSGTAAGHYLPAVMEARASGLPLVIITADRPPELQDMAAPQTVDQTRLFSHHAVAFLDLGMPELHEGAMRGVARRAAMAWHSSQWPVRGAVQINLRARKPLEPHQPLEPALSEAERWAKDILRAPVPQAFSPVCTPDPEGLRRLEIALGEAQRPLIIVGPLQGVRDLGPEIFALAERLGAPVLAEAASQLRLRASPAGVCRADGYDRVLRVPAAVQALAPDFVVQLGSPPTSGPLLSALSAWAAPRWILADRGWPDADGQAAVILLGDLRAALGALAPTRGAPDSDYADQWRQADALAWSAYGPEGRGEAAAVVQTLAALPRGVDLMLGNSLCIRHVETHVRGEGLLAPTVVVQRGVNGIDGLVAGACGWVQARGHGLCLLLGDVSLLHDASSLELGQHLPAPLIVVVLDNGGGRIFESLPVYDAAPEAREAFTTPPSVNLERLAAAYAVRFCAVNDAGRLSEAVGVACQQAGLTLIQVRVPPSGARAELNRMQAVLRGSWPTPAADEQRQT